jgi:haloalkane dehalogenase
MSASAAAMSALGGCVHRSGSANPGPSVNSGRITLQEFHATRHFAKLEQGRIAFVERGKGKAALFLHGFPLNGFQWRGVLNPLSAHRRCIALDFMGLGYTEVNESQSVAPSAQVTMIAAFLDSLSIATVDLLANDSGGGVAQLFMSI